MKTGGGQWIMAIVIGGRCWPCCSRPPFSIPGWAGPAAESADATSPRRPDADSVPRKQFGLGLMGVRTDRLARTDAVRRGGMSGYLLAFEIISIHLVVVLIGAAYLARAKRRRVGTAGDRPCRVKTPRKRWITC